MYTAGIGDVTECNRSYIFIAEGSGEKKRIPATRDRLEAILTQAMEDIRFYDRMWEEINKLYEKQKVEAERKYHYITDEEVKEAYDKGRKEGFNISVMQSSNNEEYMRGWSKVHGLYGGANYASDKKWRAYRINEQAKLAVTKVKR